MPLPSRLRRSPIMSHLGHSRNSWRGVPARLEQRGRCHCNALDQTHRCRERPGEQIFVLRNREESPGVFCEGRQLAVRNGYDGSSIGYGHVGYDDDFLGVMSKCDRNQDVAVGHGCRHFLRETSGRVEKNDTAAQHRQKIPEQ